MQHSCVCTKFKRISGDDFHWRKPAPHQTQTSPQLSQHQCKVPKASTQHHSFRWVRSIPLALRRIVGGRGGGGRCGNWTSAQTKCLAFAYVRLPVLYMFLSYKVFWKMCSFKLKHKRKIELSLHCYRLMCVVSVFICPHPTICTQSAWWSGYVRFIVQSVRASPYVYVLFTKIVVLEKKPTTTSHF